MAKTGVFLNEAEDCYEFLIVGCLCAHIPREQYESLSHEQRRELRAVVWTEVFGCPEPPPEDLLSGIGGDG